MRSTIFVIFNDYNHQKLRELLQRQKNVIYIFFVFLSLIGLKKQNIFN